MKTLLKALILTVVFTGSLIILMTIKGEALTGKKIHTMIFIETSGDWKDCILDNCLVDNVRNAVVFQNYAKPISISTQLISPGFPFTRLLLSWNMAPPDSTSTVNFQVEVSADKENWYNFDFQNVGGKITQVSREGQKEIKDIGKIETDNLVLEKPMRYVRVMVNAFGDSASLPIELRRLSLSFSSENSSHEDYLKYHPAKSKPSYAKTKLAVPYYTQRSLPSNMSGNCCSPTSLSMVLNYHGITIEPESVAHCVYDQRHDMYGNWPYNTQCAYQLGMAKTWLDSHCSFDEIYDEIASGKPVVISVAFERDQLPRSPIHEAAEGHLIAVVGFDGPDTVICNDPAGHNIDDGIVPYPRRELEDIWLAHGGIAYHLWPN